MQINETNPWKWPTRQRERVEKQSKCHVKHPKVRWVSKRERGRRMLGGESQIRKKQRAFVNIYACSLVHPATRTSSAMLQSQYDTLHIWEHGWRKRKRCLHFRFLPDATAAAKRVLSMCVKLTLLNSITICLSWHYQDGKAKLTGNPSKDHVNCGSGFPVATHFNDTVGPGCSVCSENQ